MPGAPVVGQSARGVLASGAVRRGDGTAGVRSGTVARPGVGRASSFRSVSCCRWCCPPGRARPSARTDVIIAAGAGRRQRGQRRTRPAARGRHRRRAAPAQGAVRLADGRDDPAALVLPGAHRGADVPARPAARDAGDAVEVDRLGLFPGLRGSDRRRRRRDRAAAARRRRCPPGCPACCASSAPS